MDAYPRFWAGKYNACSLLTNDLFVKPELQLRDRIYFLRWPHLVACKSPRYDRKVFCPLPNWLTWKRRKFVRVPLSAFQVVRAIVMRGRFFTGPVLVSKWWSHLRNIQTTNSNSIRGSMNGYFLASETSRLCLARAPHGKLWRLSRTTSTGEKASTFFAQKTCRGHPRALWQWSAN